LANSGDFEEINRLLKPFNKSYQQIFPCMPMLQKTFCSKKANPEMAKRLLDSARVEFSRTGVEPHSSHIEYNLAYANTLYDPKENLEGVI
jgi:hypothetical protein